MALIVDIADAVVTELNAGTFSQELTAARLYRPEFDLKEMAALHVTVVPRGVEAVTVSRTSVQYDVSVDVAVQKKLSTETNAQIDPLMGLVEEIATFFRLRRLTAYPSASWLRTENEPVYSPGHLEELRQFTSVLTVTFRVVK
ncbi:MAG: hypothetical protein GXY74_01240 [Phycisphaerae bacterium]|nr:hypothetical protein [Phycisphaerae bacterium]